MYGIPVYAPGAEDFSSNGLGLMLATECTIEETRNGMYELKMVQPIASDMRWMQVQPGCILKAAAPLRESPLYEMTAVSASGTATVTRSIYKVTTHGGRLRLRQKPSTSAKILGSYVPGTQVAKLEDNGSGWYRVSVCKGGATGWMSANYLTFVKSVTDTVTSAKPVTRNAVKVQPAREQLFRVYSVENDTATGLQTAMAMHIFYDLRGNPVNEDYKPNNAAASTAAQRVFSKAMIANDFELNLGAISGKVTGEYGYMGIAEALLDPGSGIVAQSGALLVRDNYDVFLIPDEVRDMGVTIRRGKNLVGVTVTTDDSNVITRIIPRGKKKNGDPLYLSGTIYVDSPRAGNYPVIRAKLIDYDVHVSDADDAEFKTEAAARAELKRLAQADFNAGADLPTYGMEVDFVNLAGTEDYADYAALQSVHMHDTVTIIDELIGLTAKLRVTGYAWNALTEQYDSVTLGDIQALQQTTYGFSLAEGSVSGSKLIPGSVDASMALRDLSLQYAKISVAAIEQLNANAITAVTGRFNSVTADSVETDELYAAVAHIAALAAESLRAGKADVDALAAALAEITVLRAQQITAENIQTDALAAAHAQIMALLVDNLNAESIQTNQLAAALAGFVSLYAGTGEFDFATVKNLVSKALSLEQGSAESVFIRNLAVTSANLLSATLGNLVLKGDDGGYYRVFVGADGGISAEKVTVADGEIAAGQTSDGRQIVETGLNVGDLNATNLQASSAVINQILTTALAAEKITAADALIASATIPALYATAIKAIGDTIDISANRSITLLAGDVEAVQTEIAGKNTVWRQDAAPENAQVYDLWVQPSEGLTWQAIPAEEGLPVFYMDSNGVLSYEYPPGVTGPEYSMDEDGYLVSSDVPGFAVTMASDGRLTAWRLVQDAELRQAIEDNAESADEKITAVYTEVSVRQDAFDVQIQRKVDAEELQVYMRYGASGVLELGRSDSRYVSQTSDSGFVVLQDGQPMTSIVRNTVSAPVVEARRMFTLGNYSIRLGSGGGIIFN